MTLLLLLVGSGTTPPITGVATFRMRFTDGTTTIDVSDAINGYVDQYAAKAGLYSQETIDESPRVLLLGGLSTVRANVEILNKLFYQAGEYQKTKLGNRIWVERQLNTAEDWWRSEILSAAVLPDPDALGYYHVAGQYPLTISYIRTNWWEGAEVQASLTNLRGSDNLTGLRVDNCPEYITSSDYCSNYVGIDGAEVTGDLPARTHLILQDGHTNAITKLWLGKTTQAIPYTAVEGESSTTGHIGSDGTCSSNYYGYDDTVPGSEMSMFTWSISSIAQGYFEGRYFLPLLRFLDRGTDILYYRFRLELNANVVWNGPLVNFSSYAAAKVMCEYPAMRIPQWIPAGTDLADITLVLRVYHPGATAAQTIKLDWVQFLPMESWRILDYQYDLVTKNNRIHDDGINETVYGSDTSNENQFPALISWGNPITLDPGVDQSLVFVMEKAGATPHDNAQYGLAWLYFRPRRLVLN